jgi:hypothetical protein
MATPVKGKFCKVTVGSTDHPAVNWNLSIDGKVVDYSNFRDGRVKAGTLDDASLSFSIVEDEDATAIGATGLKPGDIVTVKCYTNNAQTKYISAAWCVQTVVPKVDSQEELLRLDVSAGLNGSITWPA